MGPVTLTCFNLPRSVEAHITNEIEKTYLLYITTNHHFQNLNYGSILRGKRTVWSGSASIIAPSSPLTRASQITDVINLHWSIRRQSKDNSEEAMWGFSLKSDEKWKQCVFLRFHSTQSWYVTWIDWYWSWAQSLNRNGEVGYRAKGPNRSCWLETWTMLPSRLTSGSYSCRKATVCPSPWVMAWWRCSCPKADHP